MRRIIHNRIRCKLCGDIIESEYTHDFKFCKCGAVAVGGSFLNSCLKIVGHKDRYYYHKELVPLYRSK